MFGLTSRSSVAEVEATLRANRIRLQGRVLTAAERAAGRFGDYAVDFHFADFAYTDINSLEDAEALCVALDSDHAEGRCVKAQMIRARLKDEFWTRDIERIRSAISHQRRYCCWNHETGSFARRD